MILLWQRAFSFWLGRGGTFLKTQVLYLDGGEIDSCSLLLREGGGKWSGNRERQGLVEEVGNVQKP